MLQYTKQILFFQHHIIHPAQKPSSISAERLCYSVYISTDCTPGISSFSRRNPLYRNAAAWQCTARFYRIAFLPLEIDLSHSDFPLCQPVVQTHKIAFAVCQTDRAAAVHENHARAKEADTGCNACRHTKNVNRNTDCSHDRQKTLRGDQRHQCRTERNHHVYADRRLSCVSAAPQRSAAPDRSFEYFLAYASPFRIKAIAQTTDTASPGRSVCRRRPLRAYRIPSLKHGIPSGLRFPPET